MATKQKSQEKNKMSEIDDQILKYFEIKKRLGKGAYGIVWKAIDKKSTQTVAVKKIFDAFRNETDAQRTFREIMFLRAFRNHPNVIQLNSIHKATNNLDIYLSFEFMESDLHNVIKRGTILKDVHKRYVMYQLFNAVKYIHSGNVIHRDLKPSNVLIDSKCRCKIADFGLARSVSQRQIGESNTAIDPSEPILTDYVATRWYRAPEILVASKRYTKGIDMWSLGCILGEMILGKPLFPGTSTVNQIEKIVCALPEINEKDVAAVGAGFGSVLLNQQITPNALNPKLDELLQGSPEDAKVLVKSLLVLDPSGRLTAKQALCHKYIEKFRNTIPEVELNSDVLPPFRDDVQLTVPEYRSKLYEIMQSTDKHSSGGNKANKKKESKSPTKLENTITIISSTTGSKRLVQQKVDEIERKDNHFVRHIEKRSSSIASQNSSYSSAGTIGNKNMNKTSTMPMKANHLSYSHDTKVQGIPKVTYFKISSGQILDPALTAANSERVESQHNKTNVSRDRSTFGIEKRHSIDCGYSATDVVQPSPHRNLSSKNNIHNSFTTLNNNTRNGKYTKPNKVEDYGPPSWTSKGTRRNCTADDATISGQKPEKIPAQRSEKVSIQKPDKIPSGKLSRSDSLTNDSGSYYERRLKNLEEKINRHKMDIKALFAQNAKVKTNDTKQKIQTTASNEKVSKAKVALSRSKSEHSGNVKQNFPLKYEYTFPEGERTSKRRASDYGGINTKGVFNLRKSQVIT